MTGLRVDQNRLACAPLTVQRRRRTIPWFVDASTIMSTQGIPFRSCPAAPVAGIHVDRDLLLCGTSSGGYAQGQFTSGEFMGDMSITSVTPESPRVGDLVVIKGYHLDRNPSSDFGCYRTVAS